MNIALTFDDGPSVNTLRLLDILRENDVKATFFVTAQNLSLNLAPPAIKRMLDEGHEIANHAFDHPRLNDGRSRNAIRENIEKAQTAIFEATGKKPVFFRSPYLDRNEDIVSVVREMGMVFIGGDISSEDYKEETTTMQITETVINSACDSDIIIMHDFGNNNTIPAIPEIASGLRKKGYGFITLSDMVKLKAVTLEPGKWYDSF